MKMVEIKKTGLKPKEEIIELLEGKNKIFVIACNKCYKEYTDETNEELDQFLKLMQENGKNVVGTARIDFLCNGQTAGKKISEFKNMDEAETICVVSCGIGAQTTMATLDGKPVYTVSDSLSIADNATTPQAYHGICIFGQKCAACGQCYLNFTGGICPIVECSKSLINGPCGGAKNGKCEISKEHDCAWEKIYERLSKQNRVQDFIFLQVNVNDFSKPTVEQTNALIKAVRDKRDENFYGGLHPYSNKDSTTDLPITAFPEPETVAILLSQHTGRICEPLVKAGEKVKYGQKIGEAGAPVSAPVHSSVSGEVIAVEPLLHPALKKEVPAIIIKSDGKNTPHESLVPNDPEKLPAEKLLEIIREKGIVGLGGAMFPTHIKLKPPKPVDILMINGCECEPYLTADERVIIERTEKVFSGIHIIAKILQVKKVYFAVEDHSQKAIAKIRDYIMQNPMEEDLSLVELKTKYPQGAERMLIKKITGREVPRGGLPFEVGVVVSNVGTCAAVSDAVREGMPLVKRVITVAGENIGKPGNYEVKIGTSVKDIIAYCSGSLSGFDFISYVLKMGGPMMGVQQQTLDVPVIKGTSGIVVFKKADIEQDIARQCIQCGRCVDVCPMELSPLHFIFCAKQEKWENTAAYNVKDCIECGCCDYICPSKLPIVEIVKKAKQKIK